jgi:sensor histidine kinase regulating citrate/malate metabolism|tara:strand:+ start:853 stop:1194 length:342 start_codon:yes stop_codon:yes gene_type:complete
MKFWNTNICLTSRKITLLIVVVLLSTLVLASVWTTPLEEIIEEVETQEEKMWIPTEEDIAYQDSMYQIIQSTQNDINEIKQDIVYILERLEYEDGSWDSIRYVKGGKIDKRRN